MKVNFNQTTQINSYRPITRFDISKTKGHRETTPNFAALNCDNLSLANFPNVSFRGGCPDMHFLLGQTNRLFCAYSRREMISPDEIRTIYGKLSKRPNAQSAVNFLQNYERYMHNIESQVFGVFKNADHKGKRDFQNILQEFVPESLERLKAKQTEILNGKNKLIENMSPEIAEKVKEIRDKTLQSVIDGSFGRKSVLSQIKNIKAEGEDLNRIIKLYQYWYKLPSSSSDFDAFVVKYAKESHEAIAKRLLSNSVATIEHIKPQARGGEDKLGNFLLVSAEFNNERDTMPLQEFMMLHSDIDVKGNIQKYINDVVKEINKGKSGLANRSWYPEALQDAIRTETSGEFVPAIEALNISKLQRRNHNISGKLSTRYIVFHK